MGEFALKTEDLGKRYRLGVTSTMGLTFREMIYDRLSGLARRVARPGSSPSEQSQASAQFIWALRNISFEIQHGELVGVIGRNGAGKSTLLKILSRITDPTTGFAAISGRVGSLLEVGTGFHPELTGKENIYLNGAILGMSRQEIKRKIDEIVDFSEIEKFLDTPVKRYSSGMYVRLAFAVAAHLEPEILIVDEVLAVGDARFQEKCLGKMQDTAHEGRTVLFVSHNMGAVKNLCNRAILLEDGQVSADGDVETIINEYLTAGQSNAVTATIPEEASRQTNHQARFREVSLCDSSGSPCSTLFFAQPFRVSFVCDILEEIPSGHFEVSISSLDHTHVLYSTNVDGGLPHQTLRPGRHELTVEFRTVLLPRQYTIDLGVHHQDGTTADFVQRTLNFTVLHTSEGREDHYPWPSVRGYVRARASWRVVADPGSPEQELEP